MARPLSEAARAKMIDAALEVVAAVGLEHYSVEAVAKRSGVAKTTIYRHFDNGDALLVTAIERMVEKIPDPDTGSFRGDLEVVAARFRRLAGKPRVRQLFAAVVNRSARDPEFAKLHRALMATHKAPMRNALQRAVARGEVDPALDPTLALVIMEGPFLTRLLVEGDTFDDDEVAEVIDRLLRALAPPGAHGPIG